MIVMKFSGFSRAFGQKAFRYPVGITHRQKLDGVEAGEEVVPLEATVIFLKKIIFLFPDQ